MKARPATEPWLHFGLRFMLGGLPCLAAPAAMASTPADPPPAMTFDAAVLQLDKVSHMLSGANHEVKASQDTADALKALNRPVVTASAEVLEYQKTLSLDISGVKSDVASATTNALTGLTEAAPAAYQQIVGAVASRVEQAIPGLLSAIPDALRYQYRQTVFRPTVQAVMPLYTGGAIPAIQHGAQAGVAAALARQGAVGQISLVNLVRVYFGQQVALQLVESTQQTRDAFDLHLADARKLEAQGVLSHARVLQVQVLRDTAQRAFERAQMDYRGAGDALTRLLDATQGITPSTPLFVDGQPLPPVTQFLGSSDGHPKAREADAARDLAKAGIDLAKSRYLPQAYAFGEYNFNRDQALPIEPDWVVGVGVRYTLLSNIDRRKTLEAAREHARAADDAAQEARKGIATEIIRTYDLVETARRSFLLLDSSIAAAKENVRVQNLAFREGEATVAEVSDAYSALQLAQTQRISTAYEYDLALAALLASSDQLGDFSDYLARADHRLVPGLPQ